MIESLFDADISAHDILEIQRRVPFDLCEIHSEVSESERERCYIDRLKSRHEGHQDNTHLLRVYSHNDGTVFADSAYRIKTDLPPGTFEVQYEMLKSQMQAKLSEKGFYETTN